VDYAGDVAQFEPELALDVAAIHTRSGNMACLRISS
jgi:hypothetical protein